MKTPKYCPFCGEEVLEKKGMMTFTCMKCKILVCIQVECTIDSLILMDEVKARRETTT